MEKIAIISDIHGNIPALEAVLQDIRDRDIQRIFCLGDLVGKGPHSDIAVDRIKEVCEIVIKGNWDEFINNPTQNEDLVWHQHRLGEERLAYLQQLQYSYDFLLSGKNIRLFHASPFSLYKRVQPWDSIEVRLSMFQNTEFTNNDVVDLHREPDVVGYGDIHNAYLQHLDRKVLFNVGSVGNPLDMTQPSYVILEGRYQSTEPGPVAIQFVRVSYDIELAFTQAKEVNLPLLDPYMKELHTAKYRGLSK